MPFIGSGLVLHTFSSSIQEETKVSRTSTGSRAFWPKIRPCSETDRSCTHLEMCKVNCNFSTLRKWPLFLLWGGIVNVITIS